MNVWKEIRRRRVLRTTGLYIVGAWLVIQVASIFFPAWEIPDTALRFLIIAAFACFPIAVIIGWRYDITVKGVVRTPATDAATDFDPSLRRYDYLIIAALLAVAATVLYDSAGRVREQVANNPAAARGVLQYSIAVLPFDNLDTRPDTGFFSDGVTEEILHRLSTMRSLHVIGRTSSFAFRNVEDGPTLIAQTIGVNYLLHGSVRRDDDQVRITARLTDRDGYQVWSQSFDRKLEGIFAIQSEIASKVSSKILNEIVPLEKLPAGRTTENMDAYMEYLVGLVFLNSRPPGWQIDAETAFRKAIRLDSGFAPPYAGLAISLFIDRGPEYNDAALRAAERAMELDPDLAEGHAALGLIYSELGIDTDRAIDLLRRAIELDPSFMHSYNWLAIAWRNAGDKKKSRAAQRLGLEVEPLNPPLVSNIAAGLAFEGHPDEARRLLLRLTVLPKPADVTLGSLYDLENDFGRLDEAALWAMKNVRVYPSTGDAAVFSDLAFVYEQLGLSDWSDHWISVFDRQETDPLAHMMHKVLWMRLRGDYDKMLAELNAVGMPPESDWPYLPPIIAAPVAMIHVMSGDYETAVRIFEAGQKPSFRLFSGEMNTVDAMDFLHGLVVAYRKTGRDGNAEEILDEISDYFVSDAADGTEYPPVVMRLAHNAALRGETREAVETLRRAIDLGWNDYYWVATDDSWGRTAEDPEFQALLTEVKARVDRQRAHLESVHDEAAFRAEVRLLLER